MIIICMWSKGQGLTMHIVNVLQDLMDDPAVADAIDEETEFTALVVRRLTLTL